MLSESEDELAPRLRVAPTGIKQSEPHAGATLLHTVIEIAAVRRDYLSPTLNMMFKYDWKKPLDVFVCPLICVCDVKDMHRGT